MHAPSPPREDDLLTHSFPFLPFHPLRKERSDGAGGKAGDQAKADEKGAVVEASYFLKVKGQEGEGREAGLEQGGMQDITPHLPGRGALAHQTPQMHHW